MIRILIVLLFVAILISLFTGLYFLITDRGRTHRTVNSLFFRVGFSILLILVLIYGFYSGALRSHAPWLGH